MLTVCTWLWGEKYSPEDVAKLHGGLRRNLNQDFRLICCTDQGAGAPEIMQSQNGPITLYFIEQQDAHLLTRKGCFVRLRMFDPAWQKICGIDSRLVCMDLDSVITGPLDPLFDRPEPFVILAGANASNPCPVNGSLMMLRAGAHSEVWSDFSIDAASKIPFFEFPDDQGWIAHKIPGAANWKAGPESGVYAFQKTTWPKGEALPADARMVVFPGWRSPQKFKHLPWIKKHWTADDRSVAGVPIHSGGTQEIQA